MMEGDLDDDTAFGMRGQSDHEGDQHISGGELAKPSLKDDILVEQSAAIEHSSTCPSTLLDSVLDSTEDLSWFDFNATSTIPDFPIANPYNHDFRRSISEPPGGHSSHLPLTLPTSQPILNNAMVFHRDGRNLGKVNQQNKRKRCESPCATRVYYKGMSGSSSHQEAKRHHAQPAPAISTRHTGDTTHNRMNLTEPISLQRYTTSQPQHYNSHLPHQAWHNEHIFSQQVIQVNISTLQAIVTNAVRQAFADRE